jgi:vancomycin resistance protein YoaR
MTPHENRVQMLSHRVLVVSAVAVIGFVGVYGGLATFLAGRVASNVTVDGIAIGGMSSRDATDTLQRVLADRALRPVRLTAPSRSVDIRPGAAGLEIDMGATVAGLTGFTLNPLRMWVSMTGSENQPFKLRLDRGKLSDAVTKAATALDRPMKEGSIAFTDGRATGVLSETGTQVMVPATVDAVASAWPHRQVIPAVVRVTRPKVSAAEITRATKELAVPAMSAPVTVLAGGRTIILQPRQYAPALSTTLDGAGRLQLTVDTRTLMAAIRAAASGIERPPVDATARLSAGRPQVVPAVVGTTFDEAATSAGFRTALTSSRRTVTVKLVPTPPKVSSATAQGWRITEAISTFTTQFPVNPPRTTNIKTAVATLNGTLVRPGDQFSLNATLGKRTPAKGYQKAPVIYGGRLVTDYGGGVSQVSTTTFNAAFFAGVKINEHTAHSFYIARYPEGREATVSWPDVDQKWTNDTGFGILIQATVSGDNLTVTLWGTKTRDVEAVKGPRRNVVQPKTIVDAKPGCVPQAPTPGFDVTVTQIFKKNGAQVKTVGFNTHYIPEDTVTCTAPVAVP